MDQRLINVGFGNVVVAGRVLVIVNPKSSPMKKLRDDARQRQMLIDATEGRRTRSILVLDSNHVVLSSVHPETISQRLAPMSRGNLFIVSAPSGTGKTTILKRLLAELPALRFSVSHTTRPSRSGEQQGKDYHFVSREQFETMRDGNLFLEWAEVHDNLYGTSRSAVEEMLIKGIDVILDIDVQGARQVAAKTEAVSIFIVPPSRQELRRRLTLRGTDAEETINLRMQNAAKEMEAASAYRHIIVNDSIEEAVKMCRAVVLANRSAGRRRFEGAAIDRGLYGAP
jgi:guanylate kinase